jgi:hypothetical protein
MYISSFANFVPATVDDDGKCESELIDPDVDFCGMEMKIMIKNYLVLRQKK